MPTNLKPFNNSAENTLLDGDIASIVGAPMAENLSPAPSLNAGIATKPEDLKI